MLFVLFLVEIYENIGLLYVFRRIVGVFMYLHIWLVCLSSLFLFFGRDRFVYVVLFFYHALSLAVGAI